MRGQSDDGIRIPVYTNKKNPSVAVVGKQSPWLTSGRPGATPYTWGGLIVRGPRRRQY